MKAIVGTAGHIDHGKTALVKALSGVDTDRLPEEQSRGISIELGFAYLEDPDGGRVGIVDVPGHERFIRQMLAGAQGFDLVIVVVAADDGVMPQTEEHFDIVHILGVRRAVFVISKCDLVDARRIAEVREEIDILAAGTPFEGSEVFEVSSQDGSGIEELRAALLSILVELERREFSGAFRMPVDRCFVLKGHGVIVTGTTAGGSVSAGDEVEVLPSGERARVRELQVHGQKVDRVWVGQRTALNLVGPEKDSIKRGHSIVTPGTNAISDRFDASVEVRPSAGRPLRSHERVRVYLGTDERWARLVWVDDVGSVAPREKHYAQLALAEPMVVFPGDRFVLRDETACRTLGGGEVVVAKAQKHGRRAGDVGRRLGMMRNATPAARLKLFLEMAPSLGVSPSELAVAIGTDLAGIYTIAMQDDDVVGFPDSVKPQLVVSASRLETYVDELLTRVSRFHADNPYLPGIESEQLRKENREEVDIRIFRSILDRVVSSGRLLRDGSVVAIPSHEVTMSDADEAVAERLAVIIEEGDCMPPFLKEVENRLGLDARKLNDVVGVLVRRRRVVRVSADFICSKKVLRRIEKTLRDCLIEEESITAGRFRDLISASRKYCIPLLDYFDRAGVTVRQGDYRRLRPEATLHEGAGQPTHDENA
ncbi:MAG: selenocysteine-specific translation elongation factor [Candidatus Binatia bacterium]